MSENKRNDLSLKDKINILNELQAMKQSEVVKKYKLAQSTVSTIKSNEIKIREMFSRNEKETRKRRRNCTAVDLDDALFMWFKERRDQSCMISGPLLLGKAIQFSKQMNLSYKPDSSWIERWKNRHNIHYKRIVGEQASADILGAESYITNVLPNLIAGYNLRDIYNADETALFYKALPNGTLYCHKLDKVIGIKNRKERLTLLIFTNADGSDKSVVAVGKYKNPRCFKNKLVPLPYYFNNKAWMTRTIFHEILENFDRRMIKEKRNVLLFVDNATCHSGCPEMSNVKLYFLPSNTTSIIQPCDQGIIKAFKSHYRQNILRRLITYLDDNDKSTIEEFSKTVNVLQALYLVKHAWSLISPESIANCFRHSKFSPINPANDSDIIISKKNMDDIIEEDDFDVFCECDKEEPTTSILSDVDICDEIMKRKCDDDSSSETDSLSDEKKLISGKEALSSLMHVRQYLQQKNLIVEMESTYAIEDGILSQGRCTKQLSITDFFKAK